MPWTRKEVRVQGVRLSYLERDTPGSYVSTPVLMLHGLIAGGTCFRRLGDELPTDRRVVALDLPGGGFSDRPQDGDASFRGTADLVAAAMAALGMKRPIVLGHSYGGAIALEIATRFPELLDGMILIAPAHPFSHRENLLIRFYLSKLGGWFAHLLPRLPRRIFLEAFRHMPGDRRAVGYEDIAPYLDTLRVTGTVDYVLRILKSWKSDMQNLGHALRKRKSGIPSLLLWGELDPVVPSSTGTELMQYLESSQQVILRGVGHLPNDEQPTQCGALIRTWLIWRETCWNHAGAE